MYSLTFYEAIQKCVDGEGYIRGDRFKDGVYVKKQGENLIAIDGFNANKVVGNLYISSGIMSQKYKLFQDIEEEELKRDNSELTYSYFKAPWISQYKVKDS